MTARQHSRFLIDDRWFGDHGIGRFAREVNKRLALRLLGATGLPWSPLDPFRLSLAMLRLPRAACVFIPGYNAPFFPFRPFLFPINDLNHIDRTENSSFLKRLYYRLVIRRACRFAFRVLTVSEYSRQRIIDWAGLDAGQVVNVGNGVDACFNPQIPLHEFSYRYLLCVSSRKAHKNEARLLEAFSRARIEAGIHLVFTGQADEQMKQLCARLAWRHGRAYPNQA